ncbi:MAG TPA: cation diffusion facilitator family transporter [Dehalococcoidia bacterium]|nr:cation diffusion facilitator family transporter [Dehalococcoidia bacterium]
MNATSVKRLMPADLAGRAAALSLVANFGLMLLKIVVGVVSSSVAVLSDGIDSAQDVIAAGIAFASVRIGARPPDLTHPYGHGRAETIAAWAQSMLIAGGGVFIVYRAIHRLFNPPDRIHADIGLIAMLIAAAVNLLVGQYATRVAKLTHSPAIASDARHLWTNVVQALCVMTGLALVSITGEFAFDAIVALVLGAYLLYTAGNILVGVLSDVLDGSLTEEEIDAVEQAIRAEQPVVPYHRLRTRRSGQSRHVDFHLILPPEMSVAEAHVIADRIERRIQALWDGTVVTSHIEPAGDPASYPAREGGVSEKL